MPIPQSNGRFAHLRRIRKVLALLAVLLVVGSVVVVWVDHSAPENPAPLAREKAPGNASSSAQADRAPSSFPAEPGKVANPDAPSVGTMTPTDSPQPDPFKEFLKAQGNTLPPQQRAETDRPPLQDPFKQALEESNRRREAAAVSPFATSK
jgi:hypothetical protein